MLVKRILSLMLLVALVVGLLFGYRWYHEKRVLTQIIQRLSAETRVAEVLVTKSQLIESTGRIETTVKFVEYDVRGLPLEPRYFTFNGNVIQFQSLVVRFKDEFVQAGDSLKGKSAYLFLKVFMLDGADTQEYPITPTRTVPDSYRISDGTDRLEQHFWDRFWDYALDPVKRDEKGIKSAQLEAPGSVFLPGAVYTIRIEHDGGLYITAEPIPGILKGEQLAN